jgi:hypothetical protein
MAPSRIREGSQIRNGESDPPFRQPARWAPHVRHGKHDVDGVGGHFRASSARVGGGANMRMWEK